MELTIRRSFDLKRVCTGIAFYRSMHMYHFGLCVGGCRDFDEGDLPSG